METYSIDYKSTNITICIMDVLTREFSSSNDNSTYSCIVIKAFLECGTIIIL